MWIIIPKTKNPIKISASQRLMGGISYSDIARVSYSDGYQPKLIEETTIEGKTPDGKKSEPKNCYLLELTAKEPGASYQKINMWVEKESYLPIKADFYSLSGKKMLTSYFTLPQDWNGKTVITKIFLYDQVITSKFSIMEYSNMQMINQSTNGIEDNTNN